MIPDMPSTNIDLTQEINPAKLTTTSRWALYEPGIFIGEDLLNFYHAKKN